MRKYTSVLMMFIRDLLYKVLGITTFMLIAETIAFYSSLEWAKTAVADGMLTAYPLYRVISRAELHMPLLLGFLAVTLVLSLHGCDFSGKSEYTIRRLGISGKWYFGLQVGSHLMMYLLFWMLQVLACFGFALFYLRTVDASWVSAQTLVVEFYRSDFLHSLFPLEDGSIWFTNVFLYLGLGVATAHVSYCQRKKSFSVAVFLLTFLAACLFERNLGALGANITLVVACALITGLTIVLVFLEEVDKEI